MPIKIRRDFDERFSLDGPGPGFGNRNSLDVRYELCEPGNERKVTELVENFLNGARSFLKPKLSHRRESLEIERSFEEIYHPDDDDDKEHSINVRYRFVTAISGDKTKLAISGDKTKLDGMIEKLLEDVRAILAKH